MARTQPDPFENATRIAERKIRQARSMQSHQMRDMVKQAWRALLAGFHRSSESKRRKAGA